MKKKFFQQMFLPMLVILAILVDVAIKSSADWGPVAWSVYAVSVVGTILGALFICLEDANSVAKQIKQVFIFLLIESFVLFFVFLFMATWFEIRLMFTILFCSLAGISVSETFVSPPKKCKLVVYLMDAILVFIALVILLSYFVENLLVELAVFLMLFRLIYFLMLIVILALVVYLFEWIWQQLK